MSAGARALSLTFVLTGTKKATEWCGFPPLNLPHHDSQRGFSRGVHWSLKSGSEEIPHIKISEAIKTFPPPVLKYFTRNDIFMLKLDFKSWWMFKCRHKLSLRKWLGGKIGSDSQGKLEK